MKISALILIAILVVAACAGHKNIKTESTITKSKYRTVILMNLYDKSDEDFKTYVVKRIEGTGYIKPVRWGVVKRLHKTYIGWACVYYERNGS